MKTKSLIITGFLVLAPIIGFAQEWDDIYANPTQNTATMKVQKKQEPQKKKIVVVEGKASNMEVRANGRNIDEYNRRGQDDAMGNDTVFVEDSAYQQYEYTDRIIKYHDPESSIKITGADEVTVYVGDDIYSEYYDNRAWGSNVYLGWNMGWGWGIGWGWTSYYPWYDPWYDPWYYGYGWGYPYYSHWYSPWSYGGWYSPWSYGGYYSPWYYGYG
ncbi:MAG: hypothetical protein VB098_08845 [Petrimonas sp.]|nr:hypothetical protein [Petrimonas sp.]